MENKHDMKSHLWAETWDRLLWLCTCSVMSFQLHTLCNM